MLVRLDDGPNKPELTDDRLAQGTLQFNPSSCYLVVLDQCNKLVIFFADLSK